MSEKFQLKSGICDIKFVYNSKLVGYTTSMSHMNELGEIRPEILIHSVRREER